MNPLTANIQQLFKHCLGYISMDIELTCNKEMADMYDVSEDDIVCLDGGVYVVRIMENNSTYYLVDMEVTSSGTYWVPPEADVKTVNKTTSWQQAFGSAIDTIVNDRMVSAMESLIPWEEDDYEIGDAYS